LGKNKERNKKISATENLGYYEFKEHKPSSMKNYQNNLIEGSRLNCKGYRIQVKNLRKSERCKTRD